MGSKGKENSFRVFVIFGQHPLRQLQSLLGCLDELRRCCLVLMKRQVLQLKFGSQQNRPNGVLWIPAPNLFDGNISTGKIKIVDVVQRTLYRLLKGRVGKDLSWCQQRQTEQTERNYYFSQGR